MFFYNLIKNIEKIFIRFCPTLYLGLTRAQDSNDRYLFGSNFIKKNKNSNNIKILDVGCGSGNFYAYIKSLSSKIKYTGLDFDHEKMKSKKFKNDNFKIIAHDLRKDWFFGEFDFVWSSEVIEHLFDDQSFFQNMVKSTKKGGYIIITTPFINSYINFANKYGWSKEPSKVEITGHVRLGYNENNIKNLATRNNLKLVNIYFISECDDFRAKNFMKLNNGFFCYFFNLLYYLKILRYKRYVTNDLVDDNLKYFSIAAVFQK